MEDNTYVKLQVQSPVLLPFCDSLKEFPVVLIILLQGLDLSLMLVEKLFSEIICEKKTCSKTHTPFMTTTYIQSMASSLYCIIHQHDMEQKLAAALGCRSISPKKVQSQF